MAGCTSATSVSASKVVLHVMGLLCMLWERHSGAHTWMLLSEAHSKEAAEAAKAQRRRSVQPFQRWVQLRVCWSRGGYGMQQQGLAVWRIPCVSLRPPLLVLLQRLDIAACTSAAPPNRQGMKRLLTWLPWEMGLCWESHKPRLAEPNVPSPLQ